MSIIDTWKIRGPSVYLMFPPAFMGHIGGIVVAWGVLEQAMLDFMGIMNASTGNTYRGWPHIPFETRLSDLRKEVADCFAECPDILPRFGALFDDIDQLQPRRNVLVHGQFTLFLAPEPAIIARGRQRKQDVEERLTADQADNLFYDVIYAAGRMVQLCFPDTAELILPPLASPDKSRLLAVLSNGPQPRAKASMIIPRRGPFPG